MHYSALTILSIGLIVATLSQARASLACSKECQSTITELQQRVVELEGLLSNCDSRLSAAIQHTREHRGGNSTIVPADNFSGRPRLDCCAMTYEQAVLWPGNTLDVPEHDVSGGVCWIFMGPLGFDGLP